MSQDIFDSIDPAISGTDLATVLNDFKDALMTGLSGTSRPEELGQGGGWIDVTNDPTSWSYKIWTGSVDIEVFTLNLVSGLASVALAVEDFSVKKVTADANGAILNLVKQRIANNGQVLSGDVVGEIRFTGRTDSASNPVVAKLIWTASDDQTTSAHGGELAIFSTPDGSATLTKHVSFADGIMSVVVPLKPTAVILTGANVSTTATIAQLAADTVLVEMTGSTATSIQGIKSDDDSRIITIHNRSTANVTLKHQDEGASENDRLKLPDSSDYVIEPESSATLYYCVADTRWKLKSTSGRNFSGSQIETFYGPYNSWTTPSGVTKASVKAYRKLPGIGASYTGLLDIFGSAYAWGINTNGNLGLGDVTPRSSPVAVLGGLTFNRLFGLNGTMIANFGQAVNGSIYAWGGNANGQLGLGDVTPRSSPVAVLGGFKFGTVVAAGASTFGISTGTTAYAWGVNTNGQLGLGDVTPRSSPVAVLGGLRFTSIIPLSAATGEGCVAGVTTTGQVYAWGYNVSGQLGVGDVTPRSSPVAVLGGLTFSQVAGSCLSSRYFFVGLNTSGTAYAWGNNARGQLGVGDVTPRSSPVAVLGGLTFKQLISSPSGETMFGITSTGALYGWGDNLQGVLGVGDIIPRSSPVAVLGGLSFKKVVIHRGNTAFGLTTDGAVYAWGANANGQLGVGDTTARSSPVAVLGGLKFSEIVFGDGATDNYAVYGIQADGNVYAWGANTDGSLGVGDVTPRSSPVAVLGGLRADSRESTFTTALTVTPLTSYAVVINNGIASFANVCVGTDVYKIEVEYLR